MEMGPESGLHPFRLLAWDFWCVPLDNGLDSLGLIGQTPRWGLTGACIYDVHLALRAHPATQGEEHLDEGKLAVIIVGPMLGTNILSTSLIAWKAWGVMYELASSPFRSRGG